MWLSGSIAGLAGITRRYNGLWRFLITRVDGRVAIELERERNRATAEVIRMLPANCELLEYEPRGRLRIIRMLGPAASPAATGAALPAEVSDLINED